MLKILTVCLGNICRSPIAEELLRKSCNDLDLDVFVDSAGTANYHVGAPPDVRMIQTAKQFDCDISTLRARQFQRQDFERFDYIFTMDESNKSNVLKLATSKEQESKVFDFQQFAEIKSPDFVPDPYYGTARDFTETFRIVDESAQRIAAKLKKIHQL